MTEQQLLRDPNVEPAMEIIAEGLGPAGGAYARFIEKLENHGVQADWRYYNDGKAWLGKGLYKWSTARGTQKETTALWLSVWDGFFRVTFYIPEKSRAEALNLPLGGEIKKMIGDAKRIGKLKFFPLIFDLRSDELFDEILTLVDFRKALK